MRELDWLYEGRGYHDWGRTSQILAQQYNMHRKRGTKSIKSEEINPFSSINRNVIKPKLTMEQSMEALKSAFFGPKSRVYKTKMGE